MERKKTERPYYYVAIGKLRNNEFKTGDPIKPFSKAKAEFNKKREREEIRKKDCRIIFYERCQSSILQFLDSPYEYFPPDYVKEKRLAKNLWRRKLVEIDKQAARDLFDNA